MGERRISAQVSDLIAMVGGFPYLVATVTVPVVVYTQPD
jgi:hypothetical protein